MRIDLIYSECQYIQIILSNLADQILVKTFVTTTITCTITATTTTPATTTLTATAPLHSNMLWDVKDIHGSVSVTHSQWPILLFCWFWKKFHIPCGDKKTKSRKVYITRFYFFKIFCLCFIQIYVKAIIIFYFVRLENLCHSVNYFFRHDRPHALWFAMQSVLNHAMSIS